MIKTSLLRQSAQKYATGNIKKGDYLLYRKDLLDAIDNGDPLPEIPEQWLGFKGSSMNPELQTLMTKMHAMDESGNKPKKANNTKLIVVGVITSIIIAILVYVFIFADTQNTAQSAAAANVNPVDNVLISNTRKINSKKKWVAGEIQIITRQWNKLSPMEKTALKHHAVIQQLKSNAINKSDDDNNSVSLKSAIQKLLNALN